MTTITSKSRLLFVINAGAGNNSIDFAQVIRTYCNSQADIVHHQIVLKDMIECEALKKEILEWQPDKVIAVGGDGTLKLIAEMLVNSSILLGILPAGSANGMAKELNIPLNPADALALIINGKAQKIHLVRINDQLCIHLSDVGFNAYVVKKFDALGQRGLWGYIKAAWKVLWKHARMKAVFRINDDIVEREAVMIVVANATSYGTGIRINPLGKLNDALFEVVIVRKISLIEIFKMSITHLPFNPQKTELFQTNAIHIFSHRKVHFQIDGEYQGKVNEVKAEILPAVLNIICGY